MTSLTKELINKAFSLAYFIHRDKKLAINIAAQSVTKLEVAMLAQDKRLYYKPTGRAKDGQLTNTRFRTKVSMNELHLLQRLVYLISEEYELKQEKNDTSLYLNQIDLSLRFIKHLVKITIKRNSFYIALGLSRLLYNYTTAEAISIYSLIVQDADHSKDEAYFRARKKQLMQEIQERFGDLLKVTKTKQGEDRFLAVEDSNEYISLVNKCLSVFTPWETKCFIPTKFDPTKESIDAIAFSGKDPDKEHSIEINRIHSLMHPECYGRLIMALKFKSPIEQLDLPKFSFSNKGKMDFSNDDEKLSESELADIEALIIEQENQRRNSFGRWLSIMVDNVEQCQLDLFRTNQVKLALPTDIELLEVYQKENKILLASYLFDESADSNQKSTIVLEGGQQIAIIVNLLKDSEGFAQSADIEISYHETANYRRLLLKFRQLFYQITNPLMDRQKPNLQPIFILATIFFVILISYFAFYQNNHSLPSTAVQKTPKLNVEPKEPKKDISPNPETNKTPESNPQNTPPNNVKSLDSIEKNSDTALALNNPKLISKIPSPSNEPDDLLVSRSKTSQDTTEIVSLAKIKKIYIDPMGRNALSKNFRIYLINELGETRKFTLQDDREYADAVFKGTVKKDNNGKILISLNLINANGDIIWSIRNTNGTNPDKISDLASSITKQLLKDIENTQNELK